MSEHRPTIGHVLHQLSLAGAEVLAADLSRALHDRYRFVFLCLDEIGPLGQKLVGEGFKVVDLRRKPGLDWRVASRIKRAVSRHEIDLLHAHQYTPFFYSATSRWLHLMPIGGRQPRILFTEHGRHYPDQRKWRRIVANHCLLRADDRATAVGQFIKQALIDNEGIPAHRIEVIHNGVPPCAAPYSREQAREKMNLDRNDLVIMQVARFHPVKDHETAVRAFAIVADQVNRARMVLVGDGQQQEQIKQLAHELGLSARITFMGVREDVHELLAGADVFLLSSLSEGISVTLLEAMAVGLPICATHVGGNSEVVDHGHNGLLSPRRDYQALANNLRLMLTDSHARAHMGEAGERRLRRHFDQAFMHQAYADLYDQMLTS